jgi:MFS family permease
LSTLYLQDVRGFSALHAGLLTLPLAFSSAVCPPLAGRITATRGPRIPLVVAGVAAAIGAGLLLDLHADTTVWLLGTAYFIVGIGSGMANAPITNTAVSGMPRSQAGMAAAVASTSRQVGATLGVAVIGSILPTTVGAGIGSHVFISDAHIAALVLASCGLVLIAVGIISTSAVAAHSSARALGSPQASAQHLSHAGNVRL